MLPAQLQHTWLGWRNEVPRFISDELLIFIKANFTVKKLDEFAEYLVKKGKLTRPELDCNR